MNFQSERLVYREYELADYSLFSSVYSNEQVMKYAYMDRIIDEEEMALFFNRAIENKKEKKKEYYEFAVYLSSDKSFIGSAIILLCYQFSRIKHGEIGYLVLPQFWGKGYATEIAKTLIGICFNDLKMHKVIASCNANNRKSEKIMKKIGMVKEGELRKERFKNGHWDNELKYGILAEEWKNGGRNLT